MKLDINLHSYLLTGSGEGSTLIDTDVVFASNGLPYIPARRIKGMLKECMTEVLEIKGTGEPEILKKRLEFFGSDGTWENKGKLIFRNAFLKDLRIDELDSGKSQYPYAFGPDSLKRFFTTEVRQTALENEVAKDTSLRNYRVIKPFTEERKKISFRCVIMENGMLTDADKKLLEETASHFRYAGTRRNRGFGKIRCTIEFEAQSASPEEKVARTASSNQAGREPINISGNELWISITTVGPVVLSQQLGEKNTVFTEKHFSGNRVRGLLASKFIENQGDENFYKAAHKDPMFRSLFLTGAVVFHPLFLNGSKPLPLNTHRYKSKKEDERVNVFNLTGKDENEITKPVSGFFVSRDNELIEQKTATTFFFHNSRPLRSAGRSEEQQDTGGIFYYEALDEGQSFYGKITGDSQLLKDLVATIGQSTGTQVGRSRSAQYGEVNISFSVSEPVPASLNKGDTIKLGTLPLPEQNEFLLTLQSPLLLLNNCGAPQADLDTFKKYIARIIASDFDRITIDQLAVGFTTVELFNSAWMSKTGKWPAYSEGSAFILKCNDVDASALIKNLPIGGIGEMPDQGFGKFTIEPYMKWEKRELVKQTQEPMAASPVDEVPEPSDQSSFVDHILYTYKQSVLKNDTKTRAINDAQANDNYLSLTNNLIGSVELLFKTSTEEEIISWLNASKGKPAGEALSKAGLIDQLQRFGSENSRNRTYWTTFFRTLRTLKKIKDKQNARQLPV